MAEARDWWSVDVVREHARLAADAIAKYEAASFESFMQSQLDDDSEENPDWRLGLESPLEAIFYIWWEAMVGRTGWAGSTFRLSRQEEVELEGWRYRLDFVVDVNEEAHARFQSAGLIWVPIIVEVDGHTFHEKTPEQVARRNQRDRALQKVGAVVMHYSWTEMTTRPEECIGEVIGAAKERYWRLDRQAAERAAANQAGTQLVGEADAKESETTAGCA